MSPISELAYGITDSYYSRTEAEVFSIDTSVPHAPKRTPALTDAEKKLAVRNALRYFPSDRHALLAKEFAKELAIFGHIYMYRFRPTSYEMKAYPISEYPGKCVQAAAIMLQIQNNLDKRVAQFPHELITYGGNGSVFNNWAQYHLTMKYLSQMTEEQTLVMYSGHPHGIFPSHKDAPRAIVTNGMVIPNYSSRHDYDKMYALGNSQYGQMTAGSYCYIGPQGIVHGTTITVMNAVRKYLETNEMAGKVFVTSGLGGMSGAQPKAGVIAGVICVVAEVDESALNKRFNQGWLKEKENDLEKVIARIKECKKNKICTSIGYHGNVVALWERLVQEPEHLVDLGSDQTSLHNPFGGGYYPVSLGFAEAKALMESDPEAFKVEVEKSLIRHIDAVDKLAAKGMRFWDYGNAFLLEASRAGAQVFKEPGVFKYPSYVQDIMGDIFSLGFGPFRWICTSGDHNDLLKTDEIAKKVIEELMAENASSLNHSDLKAQQQYQDNHLWISKCDEHKLVVGSEARILYCNAEGRSRIAVRLNEAIASGDVKSPIMLSRDHHDVSGTDSPWRETSNITDGSQFCADMAVQNAIGDSFRGATSVSLHNGGGTGWGEAINGGFLLLLDGTADATRRAKSMLHWDVNNGVSRRSWSGNEYAKHQIEHAMKIEPQLTVTLPVSVGDELLEGLF
ncbi:UNVERIFIED_CONTAM: Urocanate hydratase [Siphonaria sp. JEL0065]|nr:Urocanate hydratase [Siphonaria sp. JEL0065]